MIPVAEDFRPLCWARSVLQAAYP